MCQDIAIVVVSSFNKGCPTISCKEENNCRTFEQNLFAHSFSRKHNKILSLQVLSTLEIQDAQKSQDYILILVVKYDTQLCDAARGFMSLTLNLVILELKK